MQWRFYGIVVATLLVCFHDDAAWAQQQQQQSANLLQGRNVQPPRIAPGAQPENVPPLPPHQVPWPNPIIPRFRLLEQAFMTLNARVIEHSNQLRMLHMEKVENTQTSTGTGVSDDVKAYDKRIQTNKDSIEMVNKELGYLKNSNDNMQQRITNLEDLQKQQSNDIQAIRDLVESLDFSSNFSRPEVVVRDPHPDELFAIADASRTSEQVDQLSIEMERLSSRVNMTGTKVSDLSAYMFQMSSELDDLEQRSNFLKAKTDSNERKADEFVSLRTEVNQLKREQEGLARNTTAALHALPDQLQYNPAVIRLQDEISVVADRQSTQESNLVSLESALDEIKEMVSSLPVDTEPVIVSSVEQPTASEVVAAPSPSFVDPATGNNINVVDLMTSVKMMEESLRNVRDDQLLKFDGIDQKYDLVMQEVTDLRNNELPYTKNQLLSYITDIFGTITHMNETLYNNIENTASKSQDLSSDEYVTWSSLEKQALLFGQELNETLNLRVEAVEKRSSTQVRRIEKRIRTFDSLLSGAETEIRNSIPRVDQLVLDVFSLNRTLQQQMTLYNDGFNRFGALDHRLGKLESAVSRRTDEIDLTRKLMMNATSTLSTMSKRIADHQLTLDNFNLTMAGYDSIVTYISGENFALQYKFELLNKTIHQITSSNKEPEKQVWQDKESNERLQEKLSQIELFYQDLQRRLNEMGESDSQQQSSSVNITGLASVAQLDSLQSVLSRQTTQLQDSLANQIRTLAKEHLTMIENQRKRIRHIESQQYDDFVRRKDLKTLNDSFSSEVTSLNYALESAVNNLNGLQDRLTTLEITDYGKGGNYSTPEVDFEFPIGESDVDDYWLESTKTIDENAVDKEEIKEMSNILKIVQSQIGLLQQSTSTIEDMRAKIETLAPLKNLVVRNSDTVSTLDATVSNLQKTMNEGTKMRIDLISKHHQLLGFHTDLKNLVNETRLRLDTQDDLTNRLRRQVFSLDHTIYANMSLLQSRVKSHDLKIKGVKQSIESLVRSSDQLTATTLDLDSKIQLNQIQTDDYQLVMDERMMAAEAKAMLQADLIDNITHSLHYNSKQPVLKESNPVLKRALSGIHDDISMLKEERMHVQDQIAGLTRVDLTLQKNLTHLGNRIGLEKSNTNAYVDQINSKTDQLQDSLQELSNEDRNLHNVVNMLEQRISSQTNALTSSQQDIDQIQEAMSAFQKNVKNHGVFIRRVEQAVEKHNSDITYALESFSNQSIAIHKLRRKIKTTPNNPQTNITNDILSELEILNQRHEELEHEVETLKNHRSRDKQDIDETKRTLSGFSYASFTQQVQRNANERIRLRDELGKKIRQLEIKSKEQKTSVADLEQVVMQNRNKWSTLLSVSNGLDSLREEVWNNFLEGNNRTAAVTKELNTQERKINELRGKVEAAEISIQTMGEERRGLEHTLQTMRSDSSSNEQNLLQIIQDISGITEKLDDVEKLQKERQNNDREELRSSIETLDQKVTTNENKIARLQETSSTLDSQVERIQESIATRDSNDQARLREQAHENQELRTLVHNTQQEIRNVQQDLVRTKQRVETTNADSNSNTQRFAQINKDIRDISQKVNDLKKSSRRKEKSSSDDGSSRRSGGRRSGISQSDLAEKLEKYVSKKFMDQITEAFHTDINNISLNIEQLRAEVGAEAVSNFQQISDVRKSIRLLNVEDLRDEVNNHNIAVTTLTNTSSVINSQLESNIRKCFNIARDNSLAIKSLRASVNSEGTKGRNSIKNITTLLGNFSTSLESLRQRLQTFQPAPSSPTESESKFETKFVTFRGEVDKKIEQMRTQVNLVIQSINNARQMLGSKSDRDHVHEDHQEKFDEITDQVVKVRSNVSSLIREIAEVKRLASKKDQKDKYNSLLEDVVELHSTVEQFDFMINDEVTKLRSDVGKDLNKLTDSVQDNKQLIDRLKNKLDSTNLISTSPNSNFTLENSRARRLLASVADLTSKLESYSAETRDILNENAGFVGYPIYNEVNPPLADSDVVTDTAALPQTKNVENVVVNTLDAFLSMLNDVTSLILENGSDMGNLMASPKGSESLKKEVSNSERAKADLAVVNKAIEALKGSVSKLHKKVDKNKKEVQTLNDSSIRTNEMVDNLYFEIYVLKRETERMNETLASDDFKPLQESKLLSLQSSQTNQADQISLIQEQQVFLMQTIFNVTDKLKEKSLDEINKLKEEQSKTDSLIQDDLSHTKEMLFEALNKVFLLNTTIEEYLMDYVTKADLDTCKENIKTVTKKVQVKADELTVLSNKMSQADKSLTTVKENHAKTDTTLKSVVRNLTMSNEWIDRLKLDMNVLKMFNNQVEQQLMNKHENLLERIEANRNELDGFIFAKGNQIQYNSYVSGNNTIKIKELNKKLKTHGTVSLVVPSIVNKEVPAPQPTTTTTTTTTSTTTEAPTTTTTTTTIPTTTSTTTTISTGRIKVYPPSGLHVVSDTPTTVMISWKPSSNAQQYRVILKEPDRPPNQVDTIKNKILFTALKPNTKYIVSLYSMRRDLLSRPLNKEVTTRMLVSPTSNEVLTNPIEPAQIGQEVETADNDGQQNGVLILNTNVEENAPQVPEKEKRPSFQCDFESDDICGFTNGTGLTDFSWQRTNTTSPSSDTGPPQDHTFINKAESGFYMFMEASRPRTFGQRAHLVSPLLQPVEGGQCLEFFYHMYGGHIGALNVSLTYDGGFTFTDVWYLSGDQGNQWKGEQITIMPNSSFQLVFEAVRGLGYKGDAAIDDIKLYDEPCPSLFYNCTFESPEICGFTQDTTDDFDWERHQSTTQSAGTGPDWDHTLGLHGHFMYIETSNPRQINDAARLISPVYAATTEPICLQFWYHMYGEHIESLNVFLWQTNDYRIRKTLIWSKIHQQGRVWQLAKVKLHSMDDFQIIFEGIRGKDYKGDIAIDDVSLHKGICNYSDSDT